MLCGTSQNKKKEKKQSRARTRCLTITTEAKGDSLASCCPSSPEEEVAWKWPASHRRPPPRRRRRLTRPKHTIILYTQTSALRLQSDRAPHDARRRVIYVFFFVDSSSSSRRRRAFHRARRGFHPIGTRSAESHRPTNHVSLSRAFARTSQSPFRLSTATCVCACSPTRRCTRDWTRVVVVKRGAIWRRRRVKAAAAAAVR